MPARAPLRRPLFFTGLVLGLAAPAAAGNGTPLEWIGIESTLEAFLKIALLLAVGTFCLHRGGRLGDRWVTLTAIPLFLAATGLFLMVLAFGGHGIVPRAYRDKPPPKEVHVKQVIGGWTAWEDTSWIGPDRYALVSYVGRDSGAIFLLETHLGKVREYSRSFLCFNLYDHPEPQRYSDRADAGIGLEIHRFDGMTGQGRPDTEIPYDFTVKRRDRTYLVEGRLGGVDIGGTYERKWEPTRVFFPPPGWVRPEGYPGHR